MVRLKEVKILKSTFIRWCYVQNSCRKIYDVEFVKLILRRYCKEWRLIDAVWFEYSDMSDQVSAQLIWLTNHKRLHSHSSPSRWYQEIKEQRNRNKVLLYFILIVRAFSINTPFFSRPFDDISVQHLFCYVRAYISMEIVTLEWSSILRKPTAVAHVNVGCFSKCMFYHRY